MMQWTPFFCRLYICGSIMCNYYLHCFDTSHQFSKRNDFLVNTEYPCFNVCIMVMWNVIYSKNRSIFFWMTTLWPTSWISLLNKRLSWLGKKRKRVKSHFGWTLFSQFFFGAISLVPNYGAVDIKQRQLNIHDHKLSSKIHRMSIESKKSVAKSD